MLGHVVHANRLEGSVANMQRNLREGRDLVHLREHFRREMKPGSWRGDRASLL